VVEQDPVQGGPVDYIGKGWLGIKSGRGFYNDYA